MLGKVCGWISFDGNHLKDGFVDQMRQDDEIIRPMIVGLFLLWLRFSQCKKLLVLFFPVAVLPSFTHVWWRCFVWRIVTWCILYGLLACLKQLSCKARTAPNQQHYLRSSKVLFVLPFHRYKRYIEKPNLPDIIMKEVTIYEHNFLCVILLGPRQVSGSCALPLVSCSPMVPTTITGMMTTRELSTNFTIHFQK